MDISVIIPIYNVEIYLRQCLESLRIQTYKGTVEFLCINDGSTDESLQILREFEQLDPRFVIVDKTNEGYGKTMNLGLNMAKGKYIAILESDDWAQNNMLEVLYETAEKTGADVVKSNYIQIAEENIKPQQIYPDSICNKTICAIDYPSILYGSLAIWTGLYRRDFLFENSITFNETSGASFQDTSYAFLVWLYAKKLYLLPDYLVNYRVHNINSSVNSSGKTFCICDEFDRIEKVLQENDSPLRIWQIETRMKYTKYIWNQKRLSREMNGVFYHRMSKDFFEADRNGYIDKALYTADEQKRIESMLWSFARRELDKPNAEEKKHLIRQLPKAVLSWYDFTEDASVLYIGLEDDPLAELLRERKLTLTVIEYNDIENIPSLQGLYDYVIAIDVMKDLLSYKNTIKSLRKVLSDRGKLIIGIHNPYGIRYICGDHKPHEDMPAPFNVEDAVSSVGFQSWTRYSVFSGLEEATHIIRDGYLPPEDLANRIIPVYWHADSVFEQEELLYESFKKRGVLHQFANAYLYECSTADSASDVFYVTTSIERGEENALATILFDDGHVEKKALFKRGINRLKKMLEYHRDLQFRGISVLPMILKNQSVLSMDYVNEPTGAQVIQNALASGDVDGFLSLMDQFRELILVSSNARKVEGAGTILEHGYFDMIPLNSFFINNDFVFFDQEFCFEDYPAEVIMARVVTSIYYGHPELQKMYPKEEVYKRYGIFERRECFRRIAARDLAFIRKEAELRDHHKQTRASLQVILDNKKRNIYGVEEYRRIFEDVFADVLDKKVYLFGSGSYARQFTQRFSEILSIEGIFDNDQERWGDSLEGIKILPPDELKNLDVSEIKLIICIKGFEDVLKQAYGMGVDSVAVYNPNRTYKLPQLLVNATNARHLNDKKRVFEVGYIAGVFDMFHVGHLNLIRRAKARCKYLIVGVCTDEWVEKIKKTEPVMPFEERMELIRSCRYVDEVVRIPPEAPTTWDAYNKYHFDVQFSGSDYANDPSWLKAKEYLEERGSTVVFFPYTESTSSSKLKELISRRLI